MKILTLGSINIDFNYSVAHITTPKETQDSTGLTYGLDNGRYPSPTMYSFGLNITF